MFSFFVIRNKNSLKPNEKMKEEKGGKKRKRQVPGFKNKLTNAFVRIL